jgi:NADH dehydrogenase FAD-containing subunit
MTGWSSGRVRSRSTLTVTLVEQAPAVMPTVDVDLGRLLGEELRRRRAQAVNDVIVKAIHQDAVA